jgi:VCBS repeat-containing protein
VVGNALAKDTDPDGDALVASVQTGVAGSNGGTFSIAADGAVTFDPGSDFDSLAAGDTRSTSFTYTLVDSDGDSDVATYTITVSGANDAPQPVGTIADQRHEDGQLISPLGLAAYFSDPDVTDLLTYSAGGTLPPGLTLDPFSGFVLGRLTSSASVGSPYLITVTASDGRGGSATQTFVWSVSNPAPVASPDRYSVAEDSGPAALGNALANDSDSDGDAVTAMILGGVAGGNGGVFSIDTNGGVTFDPAGDFTDLSLGQTRETCFTYTVVDADGDSDTETVIVVVTGGNDAPTRVGFVPAQDDLDSDAVSLDVSGFFSDPDANDVLTFSATGLPAGLSIDPATGIVTGVIDSSASAAGPYTVGITAEDGNGGAVTQSFQWIVTNPSPTVADDRFQIREGVGSLVLGNVIAGSDDDPDGDRIEAALQTAVPGSGGGLFALQPDGTVTFDPNGDFGDLFLGESRTSSFAYTLTDADGGTATGMVTVTIVGVNEPPVASSSKLTVDVGSRGGGLRLQAPTDADGNPLNIRVTRLPHAGVIRLADGTRVREGQLLTGAQVRGLTFDAPRRSSDSKPLVFHYRVSDGQFTVSARVLIDLRESGSCKLPPSMERWNHTISEMLRPSDSCGCDGPDSGPGKPADGSARKPDATNQVRQVWSWKIGSPGGFERSVLHQIKGKGTVDRTHLFLR